MAIFNSYVKLPEGRSNPSPTLGRVYLCKAASRLLLASRPRWDVPDAKPGTELMMSGPHHEIGCIDDFLFQYPKYGEDHSDLCYVVPALQTGKSYPLEHSAFFQQW